MNKYITTDGLESGLAVVKEYIDTGINQMQPKLVSEENIKTINGESILGEGNITIESGIKVETDPVFSASAAAGITSANITTWNNKQSAISDLATIRANASNGTYYVNQNITVAEAGWYKIAAFASTSVQPRGKVKFLIVTTGGDYTPSTVEFTGDLSWDLHTNSHFLITGHNPYKLMARFGRTASYNFIDVYFPRAFTANLELRVLQPTYCGAFRNKDWNWQTGALVKNAVTEQSPSCGGVEGICYTENITSYGDITASGNMTATSFFKTSDETLKDFKENLDIDFDVIKSIPKKYFTWKDESKPGLQIGTSAQELQKVYPELVSENANGNLTVDYSTLAIVALAAIDKLHEENEELKQRLNKLENGK